VQLTTRKLAITASLAAILAVGAVCVIPASAEQRTLTLTLLDGRQETVTVDVPPGTPLSQVKLPPVSSPIVSITDGGAPAGSGGGSPQPQGGSTPTTTTTTTTPGSTTPGAGSGSGSGAAGSNTAPAPYVSKQSPQSTTGHEHRRPGPPPALNAGQKHKPAAPPATPFRTSSGLPTAANPTLSIALPGAAPIGVPDFFIDKFRIPPFLLPIYTAAGIEYNVPWQVLAAINEIETDYGRDLSVSSAGALGWMQFLPVTWKQYGVDATQSGVKDPYNPVDSIFAAARYLNAAGASKDLRGAIFAYNHANWYVDSVLLRAKLIGGLPADLVGSISGLTEGQFPVHAKATYADDLTERKLLQSARAANAPTVLDKANPSRTGIDIFAAPGSPIVAVQDGEIVAIGHNKDLGSFVQLRDAYGNTYTYAQVKQIAKLYPVPRPQSVTTAQIAREMKLPSQPVDPKPTAPASAGHQPAQGALTPAGVPSPADVAQSVMQRVTQQRLFAHPDRPAAYAAGGRNQLDALGTGLPNMASFSQYFTQVFGLRRSDVVLRQLKVGAHVIAGTILGRIGAGPGQLIAPHVLFEIRPAGRAAPRIDPKPIIDGWKLLESTAIYRASNMNPFFGPNAKNPTIGQILLMSKEALQRRVLTDPNIDLYACGRRDIQAGAEDRRVLAVLAYLSASGIKPTVTALKCGAQPITKGGGISDLAAGDGVDVAKINGIPVLGHQGSGSITDIAVRRLMGLQGLFKPYEIVSLMHYPNSDNTIARPDHADRVHVGFLPQYDPRTKFGRAVDSALRPNQWLKLISRLNQIPSPTVSAQPSQYAIPDTGSSPTG
jgi:hypothetical protein